MAGTVRCTAVARRGRLAKARQFKGAADVVAEMADPDDEVLDACVKLLVHAGIAAADAICCARLGRHAQGADHRGAITLLEEVDRQLAADLAVLLATVRRGDDRAGRASSYGERIRQTEEEPMTDDDGRLPPIGAPATSALAAVGITRLEQLTTVPEDEVLALHGVGPKAVGILRDALAERGLSFGDPGS